MKTGNLSAWSFTPWPLSATPSTQWFINTSFNGHPPALGRGPTCLLFRKKTSRTSKPSFPWAPRKQCTSFSACCGFKSCMLSWTANTSLKWIDPLQNLLQNFQQVFLFSSHLPPLFSSHLYSPKSSLLLNSCIHFFARGFYLYFDIFYFLVNIGESISFCVSVESCTMSS